MLRTRFRQFILSTEGSGLSGHLLLTALQRKYGTAELAPLDDSFELAAHDEMCAKVK